MASTARHGHQWEPRHTGRAVSAAFRHPAVQAATGVGALLALTWPLLVFERPLYVVSSFFVIWIAVIGLLFAFSTAQRGAAEDGFPSAHPGEDVDAGRD
jgi:hypothetical protein